MKISEDKIPDLICHYEQGATISECARHFKISRVQTYTLLKKHAPEIIRRRGPKSKESGGQ